MDSGLSVHAQCLATSLSDLIAQKFLPYLLRVITCNRLPTVIKLNKHYFNIRIIISELTCGVLENLIEVLQNISNGKHQHSQVLFSFTFSVPELQSLECRSYLQRFAEICSFCLYLQCVEIEVQSGQVSSNKLTDGHSIMPKGVLDLQELRTRVKAVKKVVEGMNRPVLHQPLHIKPGRDSTASEIESIKSRPSLDREKHEVAGRRSHQKEHEDDRNRRKAKPKSFEAKNGTLMKDIPLDHVSDSSPERIKRAHSAAERVDDQMLELWETAEGGSLSRSVNDLKKRANHPTMGVPIMHNQFRNLEWRGKHPPTESEVEKELGVDKLELSMNSSEANQEMNKKILKRLASDAEKLMSLQLTVDSLRRNLEANKKAKKPKNFDFETVKEQLQEVEETVVHLVNLNSQLMKNTEESTSYSPSSGSADSIEVMSTRQKRVSEQARKGSEKIGRLQLEVQKIQYILLKLDDEKKSKVRSKFSRSSTGIILKNFIHIGRRNSEKKKKSPMCCFRPSSSSSSNNGSIRYRV